MLRAFDAVKSGVRLQRDALNCRIQFLETPGRADEGPGGAEHGDKMRDASFGLPPDFIGSGVIMRAPVGVVRILVGIKIKIGMAFGKLAGNLDGAVGTFSGIGVDNVGAVGLEDALTLR